MKRKLTFEQRLQQKISKTNAKICIQEWQDKFINDFKFGQTQVFTFEKDASNDYKQRVIEGLKEVLHVIVSDNNEILCSRKMTKSEEIVEAKQWGKLIVYTDGSCLNGGTSKAKGGIGVWFGEDDPRNISELLKTEKITNNTAELQAVIEALKATTGSIEIRMDSQYVQKGNMILFKNWKRKKEYDRPNYQMFVEIQELMNGRDVDMIWVPRGENKDADLLSRQCYDE